MKIHTKKKQYRLMVKREVQAGRINLPNGTFGTGIDNAMKTMMLAGHRVGQNK